MSNYKYGDWFCRPETEAEAAEIVRLAIASGADNEGDYEGDSVVAYGVKDGKVDMYHTKGTEYTLHQLRAMFGQPQWNGEGLPPVGTVCELSLDGGEFKWCTVRFVGKKIVVVDHKNYSEQTYKPTDIEFRPLRTKRDKWIDKAIGAIGGKQAIINAEAILGKLYDAGLAKDIDE